MRLRFDPTIVALAASLPALLIAGAVLPEWLTFFVQVSLANGLAVLGVMLQMRAGLVPFGQALFFCLGGYAAGMSGHFLGITDAFVLLLFGAALSAAVAGALGLLMSRYREIFFAMLSLAFSMILYGMLVKAESLGSTDGFNVPPTTFLWFAPHGADARAATYLLTCVVTIVTAGLLHRYLASPLGAIGEAIRENELRVEYLGASPRGVVHLLYVVAAVVTGLGGTLAAISVGHVDPDMAVWTTSGQFVFAALLSGTGNVLAPLTGTFLLELVRIYALEFSPYTWQMLLGVVMVLVILFLPGGLWSLTRLWRRES